MVTPILTDIALNQSTNILKLSFDNEFVAELSAEFLRVHSPSAEVKGHGPGQETLVSGKRDVAITAIEPVGNYAILLRYDDGHHTGIYSWNYLYELAENQQTLWDKYLKQLDAAGKGRA